MTKQKINFEEIFSFAWSKTKQHAWFLACSLMIYSVVLGSLRLVPILEQVAMLLVTLSMLSMSLIIVKNESFSFSDLFNRLRSPKLVINFFALTLIYLAAVSVCVIPFIAASSIALGALFLGGMGYATTKLLTVVITTAILLIPGVYIAVRFKFYPYVLLENENMKIVDIIKHTCKLTKGIFGQVFWFLIILSVLNIVGFLAFGVGLFLTVPVSIFSFAHLYRKLAGHLH